MYEDGACFDPNTMQEQLTEDGFSQSLPNPALNFSGEDAAMEIELRKHLGLEVEHCYSASNDTHLPTVYDQSNNWDAAINRGGTPEISSGQSQCFNGPASMLDAPPIYPSPSDHHLLNLFNWPRCSPSSVLPNSSLSFPATVGFLGDIPAAESSPAAAGNISYDPLFHLNLDPCQPPLFRELFQSLPHGCSFSSAARGGSGSMFSGMEEREPYDGGEGRHFDGVFEFAGDMSCLIKGHNEKGPTKHYTTERQRRQQLNGKFEALKKLVPNSTKNDRASIVGDAIEYIKELRRTVNELKLLVEKKRNSRERIKRHKTDQDDGVRGGGLNEMSNLKVEPNEQSYDGSASAPLRSSWLQRKSKDAEVDVRIVDNEVTIKLAQRKRINCLMVVSKVLDDLQLDIQHVAGGLVGDNFSFLFNSKIHEGSSVYASAIANKLMEVVDRQYAAIPPTSSY
ncbi:hypothetical protein NMG60_11023242 [Bertholletia excelsa]